MAVSKASNELCGNCDEFSAEQKSGCNPSEVSGILCRRAQLDRNEKAEPRRIPDELDGDCDGKFPVFRTEKCAS